MHAFTDVADSLKVKSIREQAKDLAYCGLKIASVISFDATTYFNAFLYYLLFVLQYYFVLSSCSSKGIAVERLGLTSIDEIWDSQVSPHSPSLCSASWTLHVPCVAVWPCRWRSAVCGMHGCSQCAPLVRRLQKAQ